VQTIKVGAIFQGRVLPLAFTCFLYEQIHKSQNLIETTLLRLVAACFPAGTLPASSRIGAYGRSQLLEAFNSLGCPVHSALQAQRPASRFERAATPCCERYARAQHGRAGSAGVFYHLTKKVPVDLVGLS